MLSTTWSHPGIDRQVHGLRGEDLLHASSAAGTIEHADHRHAHLTCELFREDLLLVNGGVPRSAADAEVVDSEQCAPPRIRPVPDRKFKGARPAGSRPRRSPRTRQAGRSRRRTPRLPAPRSSRGQSADRSRAAGATFAAPPCLCASSCLRRISSISCSQSPVPVARSPPPRSAPNRPSLASPYARVWPASTVSPGDTRIPSTVIPTSTVTGCSIFIDSTTMRTVPAGTLLAHLGVDRDHHAGELRCDRLRTVRHLGHRRLRLRGELRRGRPARCVDE